MATSTLNPEAPCFISNHQNYDHSAYLFHGYYANNPIISNIFSPPYVVHQTSSVWLSPPCTVPYQYFCYPYYPCFKSGSPLHVQALPPNVPKCSIQELDEYGNLVPAEKSALGGEVVVPDATSVVVVNQRFRKLKPGRAEIWVPRRHEPRRKPSVKVAHCDYEINDEIDLGKEWRTTLMIKNVPNKFSKKKLISVLRGHLIQENQKVSPVGEEPVLSAIDYFYLPIDFRTGCNFGFAFVNFTTPIGAWRLYKHLHDYSWMSYGSPKVCKVNWARIQGLDKLIENADRRTFESKAPDMYMPVHFEPPNNGLDEFMEYIHGKRII